MEFVNFSPSGKASVQVVGKIVVLSSFLFKSYDLVSSSNAFDPKNFPFPERGFA